MIRIGVVINTDFSARNVSGLFFGSFEPFELTGLTFTLHLVVHKGMNWNGMSKL